MFKRRSVIEDLKNAIETIDKIDCFIGDMDYDGFIEDEKTMFAVSKAIEIIGEILKHIPDEIKKKYADIPWQDIYGMRNFLTHNYFNSDQEEVWKTVKEDIPELKLKLNQILAEETEKLNIPISES
ncbi:MAG: DUF86 domain-containing protein [Candidatus Omnitrophota bacterium]